MATAPTRKFISKNDQEQVLQDFYNNLGDDEDKLNEEVTGIFCLVFLFFADVSKKMSKILEFILFFEVTHKELKSYQILAHYHSSIKRYRLVSLLV